MLTKMPKLMSCDMIDNDKWQWIQIRPFNKESNRATDGGGYIDKNVKMDVMLTDNLKSEIS